VQAVLAQRPLAADRDRRPGQGTAPH